MQKRPRRVQVRAQCALRVSGTTVNGVSHNVSTSGVHVTFPRTSLDVSQLPLSSQHEIRIALPEQRQETRAIAEVVWLDDGELDAGNQPVTGIGLRFLRCGSADRRRLREFIRTFRFAVIVLYEDAAIRDATVELLAHDYHVLRADSIDHAMELLDHAAVAALISGYTAEALEERGALARVRAASPQPQILIDAEETLQERLADFLRLGTELHYLGRDIDRRQLQRAVRRAVDLYGLASENDQLHRALERHNDRLRRENAYLRRRAPQQHTFGEILGQSLTLRAAISDLERVQNTDVTVHIHGETGTGKELVARALHGGGPRGQGPFIAQNCAGFTESLLQSTLFGYERGAFTGADRDRPGVFEAAHGGTLFLDEVAELSAPTQAMLLRALQAGEITKVGAATPIKVDVRLISASHKDLHAEVTAGRFREDLFYRLVVVAVDLPALRDRAGDIPLLAAHFLDVYCGRHGKSLPGFGADTMARLEAYSWPGNVRELENEVERAVILAQDGERLRLDVFSPRVRAVGGGTLTAPAAFDRIAGLVLESMPLTGDSVDSALEQVERRVLERALLENAANRSRTARYLRVPRQTLLSRMRRHGLD